MKKTLLLGIMMVLPLALSLSQFKQKCIELAFSGSVSSWTTSSTFSGQGNSESRAIVIVSSTIGYFVADGVSIEGEVGVVAMEKQNPSQYVLAGLSYTYSISELNIAPFFHAGYGVSNSVQLPTLGGLPVRTMNDMNVKVLNVGGGMKFLVSSGAALRLELNYRSHSWSENINYSYYPYSMPSNVDYKYSNVGLLIGFSILI